MFEHSDNPVYVSFMTIESGSTPTQGWLASLGKARLLRAMSRICLKGELCVNVERLMQAAGALLAGFDSAATTTAATTATTATTTTSSTSSSSSTTTITIIIIITITIIIIITTKKRSKNS